MFLFNLFSWVHIVIEKQENSDYLREERQIKMGLIEVCKVEGNLPSCLMFVLLFSLSLKTGCCNVFCRRKRKRKSTGKYLNSEYLNVKCLYLL